MAVLYWLLAAAALMFLEMLTLGLTSIWFAGGALAAAVIAALRLHLLVQVGVFLAVSILLFVLTRPLARRYLNSRTVKTNAESLVGEVCIVTETIENLRAKGQVMIRGQVWTARSISDDMILQKDSKVKVNGISGVKLIVEPV